MLDADNEPVLLQRTRAEAAVDGDEAESELLVELSLPDGTPVDIFPSSPTARGSWSNRCPEPISG